MVYQEECGHEVVEVDGMQEHHDIPDDGAPHAPSGDCGCGPAMRMAGEHRVYEHVDQDAAPAF